MEDSGPPAAMAVGESTAVPIWADISAIQIAHWAAPSHIGMHIGGHFGSEVLIGSYSAFWIESCRKSSLAIAEAASHHKARPLGILERRVAAARFNFLGVETCLRVRSRSDSAGCRHGFVAVADIRRGAQMSELDRVTGD
eukprot:CAMPEP_0185571876 /NCGR_PEP_ID=MMETSP0434-20130131/3879_1 /TAXON_ID=626734 ORGANISM="Favella taraikaensis, Strain Fe Narragansett Bay" /NCGR_SAMPLE_ID=MMETSP0434 /ASSEMBLY_ACC=CAM_ASM_000379 /LENGTH=139 /DNA_ID=CAMNT_0028187507 /DNA_START=266 /DNA_END=684 /DNA_ORIENTATION=-